MTTRSFAQAAALALSLNALLGNETIAMMGVGPRTATPLQIADYVRAAENNWTAKQTISANGAVSAPAFSGTGTWYSGGSATTTKPYHLIEPAGTTSTDWSTSGTGLGINAASGFAGNLLDLHLAGTPRFRVNSVGALSAYQVQCHSGSLITVAWVSIGVNLGLALASGSSIEWSGTSTNANASKDLALARDAADTLALRRGANAQIFNVYNTFTDSSNYERVILAFGSNIATLTTQAAGTGAKRILDIGGAKVRFRPLSGATTACWEFNEVSGHFLAVTDNTYDIGASGANRPRNIWIAGQVSSPVFLLGTAGYLQFGSEGRLTSAGSDGVFRLQDNAGTSFGRLQFGGFTSSFPALKRSATVLQARLADDSGFAPLQGNLRVHANAAAETPTATHTLRLFDAAGTEYKVLAVAA